MGRKPYVRVINTVRMRIINFNGTNFFSEAFRNMIFHLSRISCESCTFYSKIYVLWKCDHRIYADHLFGQGRGKQYLSMHQRILYNRRNKWNLSMEFSMLF